MNLAKTTIQALLAQLADVDEQLRSNVSHPDEDCAKLYMKRLSISLEVLNFCFDWESNYGIENEGIPINSDEDEAAIHAIMDGYNKFLRVLPSAAEDVGSKTLGLIASLQRETPA